MRALAGIGLAVAVVACAPQPPRLPDAPVPAGSGIRVVGEPVAEGPPGYAASRGDFTYAGGLALTSPDTSRLHGLSDLDLLPGQRFVAITDEGDEVRGRIRLNAAGRMSALDEVSLRPLRNLAGAPLSGDKADSDAEGLSVRPNGDLLVSFERNHRIWLYPADGGPPKTVPSPGGAFPDNAGMEALAGDPASGPGVYLVGREDTGETWRCRLAGACEPGPTVRAEGSLVSARSLPAGRWAWLIRDYNPLSGARVWILVTDAQARVIASHQIARPATVDNFEGLAAAPREDGSIRFYILSDDNFSPAQRTLLLAFDWSPAKGR